MLANAGIYYSLRSNIDGDTYTSRACCKNLSKTFIRANIPFNVTGNFSPLEGYAFIAAPVLSALETADTERLIDFVRNGGTLYLSGMQNKGLVQALCGHRLVHYTNEKHIYIAPSEEGRALLAPFTGKYPLPFDGSVPVVEAGSGSTVLATLTLPYTKPCEARFASIHSNPPGISTTFPALTVTYFGKGCVIWSAAPIEAVEHDEYRDIFVSLIRRYTSFSPVFTSDAPANVELTVFKNDDSITLNAAVLCEETHSIPAQPFTVRVKTGCAPIAVEKLPDKTNLDFSWADGYTEFKTDTISIFEMYRVVWK